jgi:hypothetical protein
MLTNVDPSPSQDSVLRRHYEAMLRLQQGPRSAAVREVPRITSSPQAATRSQAAARPRPTPEPAPAGSAGGWLRRWLGRVFG